MLRLIRAQSYLQGRFAAELGGVHGLSLNELMLLMHLDQSAGGRLRRVDLADRLDLSQSSVTRMVAPLEKIGLVTRGEDTRDARVGYVVLTRAGRRLARDGRQDPGRPGRRGLRRPLDRAGSRDAGHAARAT